MNAIVTFGVGLLILLAAGQLVIRQSTLLGQRLGLSPMVIGLTIVAAGTSAPELAVVGQSIAADDTELAVGSIIGSNIANILLVLGLAATMGTIHVASRLIRIDIPVMIAASVALLLLAVDGGLGRLDSVLLLAGLLVFVTWTLRTSRTEQNDHAIAAADHYDEFSETPALPPASLAATLALLAPALAVLAIAARFVVVGAEDIAVALGMPDLIIGLTVVALGTSAPEIATTLIAAARGQRQLAVGNAVGSNIFNILLVLGATGIFAPDGIAVSDDALRLDLPVLVAAALACLPIVAWDHTLDRWEGAAFVAFYLAYVIFLVLDGTGHRAADPFAVVMAAFVAPLTVMTLATLAYRQRARRRSSRGAPPMWAGSDPPNR